jgi:hypothetical protein
MTSLEFQLTPFTGGDRQKRDKNPADLTPVQAWRL